MAKQKEPVTRVEKAISSLKNSRVIAPLIILAIAVIALSTFTDATQKLLGSLSSAWHAVFGSARSDTFRREDFAEWAGHFRNRTRLSSLSDQSARASASLHAANKELRPLYDQFLRDLREALAAYQRATGSSLYVSIPDLPTDIFDPATRDYTAGVIFARTAAWSIFVVPPRSDASPNGPSLEIHFMDGDGHTVGGRGIGTVRLSYDLAAAALAVEADGVAVAAARDFPTTVSGSEFPRYSPTLATRLLEFQLSRL